MSDVVFLCLGLDETLEGEEGDASNSYASGDKKDLNLPVAQQELLKQVLMVGKPVVVILLAGSALDIAYADDKASAILLPWYPGARGGKAIADILFGRSQPSGKLPITFYRSIEDLPDFTDYSMQGRTYRYMRHSALYPFGYGLTYGNASVKEASVIGTISENDGIKVRVVIENNGRQDVSEVIQIYIKDLDTPFAVPNWSLCAFGRVSVKRGGTKEVILSVSYKALQSVDENGRTAVTGNHFKLYIGTNQPDARSVVLTGRKPVELNITL